MTKRYAPASAEQPKRPRGRPCLYTDEVAKRLCERIACGESLRSICRDDDMPTEGAVRGWVIYDHQGFASQYAHARELRADVWADQILDIAREVPADAA